MKHLILDHFLRWWWLMASYALCAFAVGWWITRNANGSFVFWTLLLGLGGGTMPLQFDLKTGLLRAISTLPLTARQIGRAWWLTGVLVPAVVLSALMFLGGVAGHFLERVEAFPAGRLAEASLFLFLWLGIQPNSYFPSPAPWTKGAWRSRAVLSSVLSSIMVLGGFLYYQDAAKNPVKFATLVGLGSLLSLTGWFRADHLEFGSFFNGLPALRAKASHCPHRVPEGFGGVRYLIATTCVRVGLMGAGMIAAMLLLFSGMMLFQGGRGSRSFEFSLAGATPLMLFLGIQFQFGEVLRQLRLLRTLPVSSTGLAAGFIAIAVLPIAALAPLLAGAVWLIHGGHVAATTLKICILILAPVLLWMSFIVWRVIRVETCIVLGAGAFGGAMALLRWSFSAGYADLPFSLVGVIAALSILLSFLLMRWVLRCSSRPYHCQGHGVDRLLRAARGN